MDLIHAGKQKLFIYIFFYRVVEEFDNLRSRFEKAVSEIRIMKRELRLAQSEQDNVELSLIAMSQELKAQHDQSQSQQGLMAAKIQDLTLKLSAAEKQVTYFIFSFFFSRQNHKGAFRESDKLLL